MTDTASDMAGAERDEKTHAETHTALSDQNSRRKSRVDTSGEFSQVRNSHAAVEKLTRPLPRKLTFSGLSIGRPEREIREGGDQQNPGATDGSEPERIGPLAAKYLDQLAAQHPDPDLAARRREALTRLTRAHQPKEK